MTNNSKLLITDIVGDQAFKQLDQLNRALDLTATKLNDTAKSLVELSKSGSNADIFATKARESETNRNLKVTSDQIKELIAVYKDYNKVLSEVDKRIKDNIASKAEEAKANKLNAEAELANAKAKTESVKQDKLINQQSKARKASTEEISKALANEAKSIAQARDQNKTLTQARNELVLTDDKAIKKLAEYNAKIDQNNAYIKNNVDALTQQKMGIGGYSDAIQNAFNKMGIGNGVLSKMVDSFKNLGTSSKESAGEVESSSKSLNVFKVAVLATVAVIATLAAGLYKLGKAVIATVTPFEYSVSTLAAILKTTSNNITELTDNARALGAATKYTASEVVGLQTELAKLGFSKQQILDSTGAVLYFAQAVGTDLSSAAALAGSTLRSFGATTEETERYVSTMAIATTNSALDFSKLQTMMPIVGAAAKSMGMEIEDTSALLGILANSGLDASSAATALRNIFLNLADSSGDLSKAMGGNVRSLDSFVEGLQRIQKSGADLGDVLQLTDKRSVVAFQNLLSNNAELQRLRGSLTDVSQAMYTMAETMEDNLKGSTTRLQSAWEEFLISIDNVIPFTKIKRSFTDMATSILTSINNMLNPTRAATEAYNDQLEKVVKLSTSTDKLIKRYDELKGKTELNADEQEELNKIMETLSDTVPKAVTEFDEYGRVIGINTDAVYEFIKAQKALLSVKHKETIEESTKSLEKQRYEYGRLKNLLASGGTWIGEGFAMEFVPFTDAEIKDLQTKMEIAGKEILGYEEQLKELTGVTQEMAIKRREYTNMTIKQLDEEISKHEKATDEITKSYVEMARKIRESKVDEEVKKLHAMDKKATIAWLADVNNTNIEHRKLMQNRLKNMDLSDSEIKEIEDRNKEIEKLNDQRIASELATQRKGLQNTIDSIENEYRVKIKAIKGNGAAEIALREQLEKEKNEKISETTAKWENNRAKTDLENRLAYAKEGSDEELKLTIDLLKLQQKEEVEAAKSTGAEVLAINNKYDKLIQEAKEEHVDKQLDILNNSLQKESDELNSNYIIEQSRLSQRYATGLISKERYEQEMKRLTRIYSIDSSNLAISAMQKQIDHLEKLIQSTELSEEKIAELKEQIKLLKQEVGETAIKINVEVGDDPKGVPGWMSSLSDWMERNRKEIQQTMDLLSSMTDFTNAMFDRKIQKVEEEQEANQAAYDADIERIERLAETGAISSEEAEARKRAAEDRTAQKEAELAKKKAELQTRQAKFEKANNIINTIMNTSASIIKTGATLGFPAAIPFIALAAATGAFQLATIIAQPIPKYAKGTKDHTGGLAIVGDGGKQETVITPSGKTFITPKIPTLVDLPKHSVVLPDMIDSLDLETVKQFVKSDAMAIYENLDRSHDAPIVYVSTDTAALQVQMKKMIGETNDLLRESMKRSRKSGYISDHFRRVRDITRI